ncbi:type II toxin-antitoxin system RelE/ParE family toxin [Kordiimonas sp.]|uniref:type II toxin-antitoxin system RelE/ParE family toxin n=1 Tax=Kordiimonas sp. TaxID=1970157 RepID=UPI003A8F3B78
MAIYRLFPAAEADLENIWHYTLRMWGTDQAVSYLDGFEHAFRFLSNTPHVCRERFEFTPPVRIFHHEKHLIVYLVREGEVHVVRILHENMDVDEQLADE